MKTFQETASTILHSVVWQEALHTSKMHAHCLSLLLEFSAQPSTLRYFPIYFMHMLAYSVSFCSHEADPLRIRIYLFLSFYCCLPKRANTDNL